MLWFGVVPSTTFTWLDFTTTTDKHLALCGFCRQLRHQWHQLVHVWQHGERSSSPPTTRGRMRSYCLSCWHHRGKLGGCILVRFSSIRLACFLWARRILYIVLLKDGPKLIFLHKSCPWKNLKAVFDLFIEIYLYFFHIFASIWSVDQQSVDQLSKRRVQVLQTTQTILCLLSFVCRSDPQNELLQRSLRYDSMSESNRDDQRYSKL